MSTTRPLPELASKFKKTPYSSWNDIPSLFGDVFFHANGLKFNRFEKSAIKKASTPLLFKNEPVVGDLIPSSSWGSSLANLLTKTSWDKLRHPIIETNHHVCQLCGNQKNELSIHEVWKYIYPSAEEMKQRDKFMVFGIQELKGFVCVCHDCHECFHLGLANANGRFDTVVARLKALNNWDQKTTDQYISAIFTRFDNASQINWMLNLENIKHPDGKLTIKGEWGFVSEKAYPLIERKGEGKNRNITVLLNTPFTFVKDNKIYGPFDESVFA